MFTKQAARLVRRAIIPASTATQKLTNPTQKPKAAILPSTTSRTAVETAQKSTSTLTSSSSSPRRQLIAVSPPDTRKGLSTERLAEMCRLYLMSQPILTPVGAFFIEKAQEPTVLGSLSQNLLTPFCEQFGKIGTIPEVMAYLRTLPVKLAQIIVDHATEDIKHLSEGAQTKQAYLDWLDQDISMLAVKLTGLCPVDILAHPDQHPEAIKQTYEALREVVQKASLKNQKVFIDAEYFVCEGTIRNLAKQIAKEFPDTVVLTYQATRIDSLPEIKAAKAEFDEEGIPFPEIKGVKGAYKKDRCDHPQAFNQTFEETHKNYLDIMAYCVDNNIRFIACTHNDELLESATSKGLETGQLWGMHLKDDANVYFITSPKAEDIYAYLGRRLEEHSEAFKPRRLSKLTDEMLEAVKTCFFGDGSPV